MLPRWLSDKRIYLPVQETKVPSLGWENLLEKEMATHSSVLAWKIPWTEEPGGLQCIGWPKSQTQLSNYTTIKHYILENDCFLIMI